jgi:hypothetical protein
MLNGHVLHLSGASWNAQIDAGQSTSAGFCAGN